MSREGWIRLDTPEAMESFRREHYLFVYTTALDLVGSPLEANRLAEQVLQNTTRRFANRVISQNCDMYLAAQVNLLYSQRARSTPEPMPEPAGRAAAPLNTEADRYTTAFPDLRETPRRMRAQAPELRTPAPLQARAANPEARVAVGEERAMPAVSAASPVAPLRANGTAPEMRRAAPAFRAEAAPEARTDVHTAAPEARAAAPLRDIPERRADPPEMPPVVKPPAEEAVPPMAVPQPSAPPPFVPVAVTPQAAAPQTVAAQPAGQPVSPGIAVPVTAMPPQPGTAYTILVSPSVVGSNGMPSVTISAQSGAQGGEAPAPQAAAAQKDPVETVRDPASYGPVFNPKDTEAWTPEGDEKSRPAVLKKAPVAPPEPKSAWEEEYEENKPSIFLTILNSLLTVASIASIVYLLYRLDVLPKFF